MIKEYYAAGSDRQAYFTQIPPHTPSNNTGHYSGCGATAWMNLYGWHNLNFTSGLLNGDPTESNDYTDSLTMRLHNYLHTTGIPFSDQGLTLPWCMNSGCNFAAEILSHAVYGYKYRIRNFAAAVLGFKDGNWIFELAKEYIINKKKPVIVGYIQNWHYAIGYGILEIQNETDTSPAFLLKINKGWSTGGSPENIAEISPDDLFSCYGVDGFSPLS